MQIFYNGSLFWTQNDTTLSMQIVDGYPAPVLGVFIGPTYLTSPWSFGIY